MLVGADAFVRVRKDGIKVIKRHKFERLLKQGLKVNR